MLILGTFKAVFKPRPLLLLLFGVSLPDVDRELDEALTVDDANRLPFLIIDACTFLGA
jgi:hypothetical protein